MEKQYKLVNGIQVEVSEVELKEYYDRQPTESQILMQAKKEKVARCKAYLLSTDWQVIRLSDPTSGKALKESMAEKRALARTLQVQIESCTTIEELNNINTNF